MKASVPVSKPVQPMPVDAVRRAFQRFTEIEGFSGILLMAATLAALVLANSPWASSYFAVLGQEFTIGFDHLLSISQPILVWINDGLMAIFFFVVGLEIKRELLIGELSSFRRASLPIMAAIGGMTVPALIYLVFNAGKPSASGWGIPMATDIAFALGVLSLLGRRVPVALKVFLTALAIVDDLGAVLVIAFFYTSRIVWIDIAFAAALLALLALYGWLGGRRLVVYAVGGFVVWVAFVFSGVHATVAGVLVALTVPVRTRIDAQGFVAWTTALVDHFVKSGEVGANTLMNSEQRATVREIEIACEHIETPLHRIEYMLHPWVAFVIMPIFAFANAGVPLNTVSAATLTAPVSLGIFCGLVFGKMIGISLASFIAVRAGLAALPRNTTWRHMWGVAWLGGMGFTMSLFISSLAFGGGHDAHASLKLASPILRSGIGADAYQDLAKIAILLASLVAALVGTLVLRRLPVTTGDEEPGAAGAH